MPAAKKGAAGSRDGSSVGASSEGSSVNSDTSLGVLGRNEEGSDGLVRGSTTSKKASWDGRGAGRGGSQAWLGATSGLPPAERVRILAPCWQRVSEHLPKLYSFIVPWQEAFFAVLYYVFNNRILETTWQFFLLHTLWTWAQLLNVIFSPNWFGWNIDWAGNK